MSTLRSLLCIVLLMFAASPALATQPSSIVMGATAVVALADFKPKGPKHPGTVTRGVPGPMVGVGLPALVVAGGFAWFVRRRARNQAKKRDE